MLSENLKTARNNAGLTQDDVAAYLNVKRQTYSAYEIGRSTPNPETLNMLSKLYKVSVDWLLGNTDDPTPPNEKNAPPTVEDAQKVYNALLKNGILKPDIKLNEKQLEFLTEFFKNSKDFIRFNIDKFGE